MKPKTNFAELIYHTHNGSMTHGYVSTREQLESSDLFTVGQVVIRSAFVDCFGKAHPAVTGLKVTDIVRHANKYGTHIRLTASDPNSWPGNYFEGNETFFVASEVWQEPITMEVA